MKFRHFLIFTDSIGEIEISEPIGFDQLNFTLQKSEGSEGRDVFFVDKELRLKFVKDFYEFTSTPQILPNGVEVNHLSHAYDYLFSEIKLKGWECNINYKITKDDTDFIIGSIDGYTAKIRENEIDVNIIQNNTYEVVKRREDVYINAFSDKDLDDNSITPCSTVNILLDAKPIYQQSKFEKAENSVGTAGVKYIKLISSDAKELFQIANNGIYQVVDYGVEDTLSYLSKQYSVYPSFDGNNFTFFKFKYDVFNVKFDFNDIVAYWDGNYDTTPLFHFVDIDTITASVKLIMKIGYDVSSATTYTIFEENFTKTDFSQPPGSFPIKSLVRGYFPEDMSITIPYIESGKTVWIYFEPKITATFSNGTASSIFDDATITITNTQGTITVSTTSVAVPSVIKGVRLKDLIKHNVLSICGKNTTLPIYDNLSEHYDNFAFNGNMIAQDITKPFNNKFKDIVNIPKELNCHFQINPENLEVKPYNEFYTNTEIASFLELPDEQNQEEYNKKYFLKRAEFSYKKSSFEKSTSEKDSNDDVHTESQYTFKTTKTDGVLKVEIDHIRSAFLIEEQRKKIVLENKASENDENLFIIKCESIPANSRRKFTKRLRVLGGKILSDNSFNWTLLGFNVGDTILVNGSSVTVLAYEQNLITTSGSFGSDEQVLTIDYPLTNVLYKNKTNNGYAEINGIKNPDNYSNLDYHIKRNLINYYPNLGTATHFLPDSEIKNTLFRVNGNLETRKNTELTLIKDKESINTNSLTSYKKLTPLIYKIYVFCEFEKALQLFQDIRDLKGFIRVKLNSKKVVKGYPMKANYDITTGELKIEIEERFEESFVTISKIVDDIYVNSVKYNELSFKIFKNYVSLYDSNSIDIIDPTLFTQIKVNGVFYSDKLAFSDALEAIL